VLATDETASTPPSLTDQAYAALRAMILDLRLLPGQRLVVQELAEALGMSRTPVREALVRLAAEALVEGTPNKGMRVAVPTLQVFREVYEIVEGIEGA
jgi:DNA-binding GntR family transcriptional regulator